MKSNKLFFLFLLSFVAFFYSCTNNDEILENTAKDVEILANGLLKFKDQSTFDLYVSTEKSVSGFNSFYDHFINAMDEAESYYDRDGGYEEFKAKYKKLYFPEEGLDYSAYLPVSDENVAKFLNKTGNVMIGDNIINMIDINSYSQLEALGRTVSFEEDKSVGPQLRANISFISATYTFGGDRRIWIYTYFLEKRNGVYHNQVEVCFRKKGFLGQWYNYSSSTTLNVGNGLYVASKSGVSSHDYYVECTMLSYMPVPLANSGTVGWLGHTINITF